MMANLRTFLLAYATQSACLGGNAQPNGSDLADIVPKREVLYVGGQYTNVTASSSPQLSLRCGQLRLERNRTGLTSILHQRPSQGRSTSRSSPQTQHRRTRPSPSSSSPALLRPALTSLTLQMDGRGGHPTSSPRVTQSTCQTSPRAAAPSGIPEERVISGISAHLVPSLISSPMYQTTATSGRKRSYTRNGPASGAWVTRLLTLSTRARCSSRLTGS